MPEPNISWLKSKPHRDRLSQPIKHRYSGSGHNFILKLFDYQVQCAFCAVSLCAFSLAAQCTACKMLCHTNCLEKGEFAWIPLCLADTSPPPLKMQKDESKPHQWVSFLNLSAKWCCHCGLPLSLGRGNQEGANMRCEKCDKTCHAQCQLLVPSRCGSFRVLPPHIPLLVIQKTPFMYPLMSQDPTTSFKRPKRET
jgi:hypothetical protein